MIISIKGLLNTIRFKNKTPHLHLSMKIWVANAIMVLQIMAKCKDKMRDDITLSHMIYQVQVTTTLEVATLLTVEVSSKILCLGEDQMEDS